MGQISTIDIRWHLWRSPSLSGKIDGSYAIYFRDLEGNKLNIFHMEMPNW